ncbi:MAG: alpha/beta hydrolase-fold protein [Vicinamibacterales bacterium]
MNRPDEDVTMLLTLLTPLVLLFLQAPAAAPRPVEGDFVVPNSRFTSGETLPQLTLHYRTWGTPKQDAQGVVRNAVLVMHGTGGTSNQFTAGSFAGELFGPGQPLDATQFYIIAPDDIGHGQSSKPSDGLRGEFPRLRDLLRTSAAPALTQAPAGPNPDIHYQLGPDSLPRADVPKGEVRGPFVIQSQAYPGTQHTYWVYVPVQYDPATPASLMIFNDGQAFMNMQGDARAPNVLDNLILRREIPVMLAVFINPGRRPDQPEPTPQEWGDRTTNRPTEYNTLDDKYARVVVDELMPALDRDYHIAKDPERRGIGGASSGAIAAFTVAWERPDQFRKVLSIVGSFTNIRGGHAYSDIVRKAEKKPLRVFLQDGRNDNRGVRADGTYDETRDWFANNVKLMRALTEKGYDVNYTWGIGRHGQKQGGAILPDMMRWLWRDQPVSTDVNDSVERAFNTGPAGAKKGGQ